MSSEKINELVKELVINCRKENILGTHQPVVIEDIEFYATFDFRRIGMPINKVLEIQVKDRTQGEHLRILEDKFDGNIRDYLLSMGALIDEEIKELDRKAFEHCFKRGKMCEECWERKQPLMKLKERVTQSLEKGKVRE